ncbi:MAG: BMC domain-containing protein [Actinomycetota bacterium]
MNPALALLEFGSIAAGIQAGDAMIKRGPVAEIIAGTVHPGRYLVLVTGEVGAVEEAVAAGVETAGGSLLDRVFLPDVHPAVADAVRGERLEPGGEAVGVIETTTVAAAIEAADAAVKGAMVILVGLHLADGLGGKGYAVFSGTVSDVQAAVGIGVGRVAPQLLVGSVVIPRLHDEMGGNLFEAHRFGSRVGWDGGFDAAG